MCKHRFKVVIHSIFEKTYTFATDLLEHIQIKGNYQKNIQIKGYCLYFWLNFLKDKQNQIIER